MLEKKEQPKWSKGTSERDGRERDLETYEGMLGFSKEDLKGKNVLDIGSGEKEVFSKELKDDIGVGVVSVNPDFSMEDFGKHVKNKPVEERKSLAAIGQELPFKNETFDKVFSLYALTTFASHDAESIRQWMSEITRVLKPGGEIRLAPIGAYSEEEIRDTKFNKYLKITDELADAGYDIRFELIRNKDFGLNTLHPQWIDEFGQEQEEIKDVSENVSQGSRIIITKPK